ncbi:MAG: DUF362 domain-containing protein [Sedimentisphaerales bacterium]|nr:DUF362 domain-containing protein [Sedimentisphaerales bacterium]
MIEKIMKPPIVALTRCTEYNPKQVQGCLLRQFELLGGIDKFIKPGDSVLIKPNLIAPKSASHATQTHPAVIVELAKILKDYGAKPFIADSPAWADVAACIKKLKIDQLLKALGVPFMQLDLPQKCTLPNTKIKTTISRLALDADVIINLPKFKSHQQLVATFAVKNMFGCVPGKRKALWHFRKGGDEKQFCEFLIDIYRFCKPALTIIDAIFVMDGPGPINGRARPLGWLIGSTDPIACETVCAKLINTEPDEYPIIKTARQINFGCSDIDKINILGDDYKDNICTDFEMPELIPIRFTLPRICKSIIKQFLILLRLRKP